MPSFKDFAPAPVRPALWPVGRRPAAPVSTMALADGSGRDLALALAIAEEQLHGTLRENELLRVSNQRLMTALSDVSRQNSEAYHLAHHDALTGLPNRLMLLRRLQDGIADAFVRQQQLALMFIDLDGFKVVNDRYGHTTGDKLLGVVARRIVGCVRSDDVACRYGGDEFVVMLSNLHDGSLAVGLADEIRRQVEGRYCIDGIELTISASIGMALYPVDGEHHDTLLEVADASMYRNKSARVARQALAVGKAAATAEPEPKRRSRVRSLRARA